MTLAANLAALARRVVGISANNLVALDGSAKLPAVDGSQLMGLLKGGLTFNLAGTAVDVTGIPVIARRVTIIFSALSTNGSSQPVLRLGTSAGIESTLYIGCVAVGGTNAGSAMYGVATPTGISMASSNSATYNTNSVVTLFKTSGNAWVWDVVGNREDDSYALCGGGRKFLSGILDRFRVTTVNGTDTFDIGTVTVYWE